jgi:hypothetical protein
MSCYVLLSAVSNPPLLPATLPPPPTLRAHFNYMWLCYQDQKDKGELPPLPPHPYPSGQF